MGTSLLLVYILLILLTNVYGSGPCKDIDHDACVVMAAQSPNMCSDPILKTSACPKFCNNCQLTCYNCTLSSPDVKMCNTMQCGSDQACMVKEVKPLSGGIHTYTLGCEKKTVCDGNRKRFIQSRSVIIDCCLTDLCNDPNPPTTSTTMPTTMPTNMPTTMSTTMSTTKQTSSLTSSSNGGQWSEWTNWGACSSDRPGVTGVARRTRFCYNPHNSLSHTTCINGNLDQDLKYCPGGVTTACTPAQITNIVVKGTWQLNGFVVLQCFTTGNPKPTVVWHTNTHDYSVQTYNKSDPSQIVIGPIAQRHAGRYICEASNTCGSKVQKTYVAGTPIIG